MRQKPSLSPQQRRLINLEIQALIQRAISKEAKLHDQLKEQRAKCERTISALARLIEAFEEKSSGIAAQLEFLKSKVSVEEIRGLTIRMGQLETSLRTIQDYIKQTLAAFK